jgi:hypothetical protein
MNCKKGDLAIIVGGSTGYNIGKIVTCLRFIGWYSLDVEDAWEVDIPLGWTDGVSRHVSRDCYMRPIRPSEEPDEMLRIVGLPEKVIA